ncbi:MAG TPA: polyphenol oxidase family protein [Methylomirabilota bacterium]|nr:polyphenol oxidase family protein [Methylomirabilota bacterium]
MTRLVPHGEPPTHFRFSGLAALGLPHITTTRHFPGVTSSSEPTAPFNGEARQALKVANLDGARLSYLKQVHGVEALRAPTGGGYAGVADILTTTERGIPVAVFAADCLPIVLWDSIARVLTVAHAGWRGTAKGVPGAAVKAAVQAGARADQLHVAIGPSIGPCCYEVDEPVLRDFGRTHGRRAQAWFKPAREDHAMLDLWSANEALLADAGVDRAKIQNPRLCTACNVDLLYSYRKGNRGRLVTVAALP